VVSGSGHFGDLKHGIDPEINMPKPYRYDRLLGSGGNAGAFVVRHPEASDELVMKVGGVSIKELEALERVRRVANTPTVFEEALHGDPPRVVLTMIPGETLLDLAKTGGLPQKQLVKIAAQTARTLANVHAAGVVHRDLGPQNIVVPPPGVDGGGIIDFGSALPNGANPIADGYLTGTPALFAPETLQLFGDDPVLHPVAPSMDVFALGVALYYGSRGTYPPHSAREMDVSAFRVQQVAGIQHQRSWINSDVDRLIADMVCEDPDRRPTAKIVAARFQQLAGDLPDVSSSRNRARPASATEPNAPLVVESSRDMQALDSANQSIPRRAAIDPVGMEL
jgi:serine/threonine protein kinase